LNAPIGVWFSCFAHLAAGPFREGSGHAYCGVGVIAA
jgi:hypothetical protein